MALRGRVESLDGKLTVRYESARYSSAELDVFWWPLSEDRSVQAWRLEGREVVSDGRGTWRGAPEDPDFWQLRHCVAAMLNGEKTQSVKKETTPVPPPKVRKGIETRWRYGAWEKLLKSGWVPT